MTFNSTLGHYNQNSYVSLAEATAYFSSHLFSATWTAFADAVKQASLVTASRILDQCSIFVQKNDPYFSDDPYKQALAYPLSDHTTLSNTAGSGSTTTIVCSDLADASLYRDDFFLYGSARVTAGTNIYEHRAITDFAVATGTLTVDAFSSAIDSTSEFTIFYPLPQRLRDAVCEFALEIAKTGGLYDEAANAAAVEPGGRSSSNVLPGRVLTVLGAQSRTVVPISRV